MTTIFCSDGSIVRLGMQPHPLQAAERRRAQRAGSLDPLPLPGEQGLCIGRWGWAAAAALDWHVTSRKFVSAAVPERHLPPPTAPPPSRSVFSISATNGIDTARRLNLLGFCFSTEQVGGKQPARLAFRCTCRGAWWAS